MPTERDDARTLLAGQSAAELAAKLPQFFDKPVARMSFSVGPEGTPGANQRRFTGQVKDRLRRDWAGRRMVLIYLTATADGDASAAGNTVAFLVGTVIETLLINGAWRVLTSAAGQVVFDVTVAGVATRYAYGMVLGIPDPSDAVTWA